LLKLIRLNFDGKDVASYRDKTFNVMKHDKHDFLQKVISLFFQTKRCQNEQVLNILIMKLGFKIRGITMKVN
jgi:hypothetical protein